MNNKKIEFGTVERIKEMAYSVMDGEDDVWSIQNWFGSGGEHDSRARRSIIFREFIDSECPKDLFGNRKASSDKIVKFIDKNIVEILPYMTPHNRFGLIIALAAYKIPIGAEKAKEISLAMADVSICGRNCGMRQLLSESKFFKNTIASAFMEGDIQFVKKACLLLGQSAGDLRVNEIIIKKTSVVDGELIEKIAYTFSSFNNVTLPMLFVVSPTPQAARFLEEQGLALLDERGADALAARLVSTLSFAYVDESHEVKVKLRQYKSWLQAYSLKKEIVPQSDGDNLSQSFKSGLKI